MIITYILAHILMFAAWTQLLYAGVFAEETNIYSMILILVGIILFGLHCGVVVHDVEQVLENK